MATITRQTLLDLESDELGKLINAVPADIQDAITLLLADLYDGESIEIPDEYLEDIIDNL